MVDWYHSLYDTRMSYINTQYLYSIIEIIIYNTIGSVVSVSDQLNCFNNSIDCLDYVPYVV